MDVRNLTERWVVVTGAASGIGRASALAFAERGANLALCDLNEADLEETAAIARDRGVEVVAERADVAKFDSMTAFAETVHNRVQAVDILMNNAGVAIGARFQDTPLEDWRWILDINVMGVVHGCHAFLPRMVSRGAGGHVVNVASAAGFFAAQHLGAYSTTKFAVVGLSEAMRDELKPEGIGVTAICPGIINTPITRAARLHGNTDTGEFRDQMVSSYKKRNYGPERAAQGVLKAVQRNRAVAPITPEAWAMYYAKRFVPGFAGWLSARFSQRANEDLA